MSHTAIVLTAGFLTSNTLCCVCLPACSLPPQPLASKPGSIRGDFSIDLGRNICHGSDSPDAAEHELKMWFPEGVNDWSKSVDSSVYE